MIPTRTLGKPFFLNLPRCSYHEASRLHFLQLLANTVAGRWGTSLDVLWSETLMWWNSNLEHYDVEGGISRNEWNRSESLYEQIYPASYFLWSHRLSGFNLNLFAYRISAPFIYLIRWYRDTFYQSGLPIPSIQTTRLNLSGQKSRWKGSELRRLSSPQMNHTLTASRSWQSDALSDVDFSWGFWYIGLCGLSRPRFVWDTRLGTSHLSQSEFQEQQKDI